MVRYFHDGEVKLDSLIRGYFVYSENQDSTHVHKRQAKYDQFLPKTVKLHGVINEKIFKQKYSFKIF